MSESDPTADNDSPENLEISPREANNWWRAKAPVGAILNNLMFVFIVAPVALVFKNYYVLSFAIFALMVPYGLLVRQLAVSAVRAHVANHPECVLEFREAGIIL
jgi:hypothetical protein